METIDILDYWEPLIYAIQKNCSSAKDNVTGILDFRRQFPGNTPFIAIKLDTMRYNFSPLLGPSGLQHTWSNWIGTFFTGIY
jgi:hypothetical protein